MAMVGQEGLASLPLRAGPHLIAPLPFWVLGVHRLWVPLVAEFSIQTPPELGSSSGPYGLALTPRVFYTDGPEATFFFFPRWPGAPHRLT